MNVVDVATVIMSLLAIIDLKFMELSYYIKISLTADSCDVMPIGAIDFSCPFGH